jgi:coenzyme PQQ synthesis protein D (PqqD)
MKRSNGHSLPKARKADLVTRQIPGELLVYDLKRHKAFCLNDTAATVWKKCDGHLTVRELAAELESRYQSAVDERVVWLALDQLESAHLLQTGASWPRQFEGIARRRIIRAGIVTAIALPLITAITSPVAAQAGTAITPAVCGGRRPNDLPGGTGCQGTPCTGGGTCQSPNPGNNPCQCL